MAPKKPQKRPRRPRGSLADDAPIERKRFALNLSLARQRKYRTQAAFAKVLGLEEETYRQYERARAEPNIQTLVKIAKDLNVSLDFLVLGDLPGFPSQDQIARKLSTRTR